MRSTQHGGCFTFDFEKSSVCYKDSDSLFFKFKWYRPRRSLLYVPGNETKKVVKAAGLKADVVVLDSEDGVAQSAKACIFLAYFMFLIYLCLVSMAAYVSVLVF